MSYLLSFVPWIVFGILPHDRWLLGAAIGLAAGVLLIGRQMAARRPADAMIIELSGAVFFALLLGYAVLDPNSPLREHISPVSQAWLAATAWGSLLVRRPFTLGIARQAVPPRVWSTPAFRRTNTVITAVWAGAFTVAGAVIAVLQAAGPGPGHAVPAVQIGGFVLPMLFTRWYAGRAAAAGRTAPAGDRAGVR